MAANKASSSSVPSVAFGPRSAEAAVTLHSTLGDALGTALVGTAVAELVAAAVVGADDVGPAVV